jgi:hypothetical protein
MPYPLAVFACLPLTTFVCLCVVVAACAPARQPGPRGRYWAGHRVCHPGDAQGAARGQDPGPQLCDPGESIRLRWILCFLATVLSASGKIQHHSFVFTGELRYCLMVYCSIMLRTTPFVTQVGCSG